MNVETVYAGIIGGVVADALGVPFEFSTLDSMMENPATTMVGYGTHGQPEGTWSDDSSMTLATVDSLIHGVDYEDMIQKFCEWLFEAKYTPHGEVFDNGCTTYSALSNYRHANRSPLDCGLDGERDNGNGSLMRIMPIVLYANAKDMPIGQQIELIGDVSALTHAHKFSKASCNIYNFIAQEILDNPDKDFKTVIVDGIDKSRKHYENEEYPCFDRLYGNLFSLDEDNLSSKGYVVYSLETALYCCYHTGSYEHAVLKAVNFGGDTDTNAIIAGALAALYYGFNSIPREWLDKIVGLDYIKELCDDFYKSLK